MALSVSLFEMHFPPLSLTKKFSRPGSSTFVFCSPHFRSWKGKGQASCTHIFQCSHFFVCYQLHLKHFVFLFLSFFILYKKVTTCTLSHFWKPLLSGISFKWTRNLNTRSTLICHENYVSIALFPFFGRFSSRYSLHSITPIFPFNKHRGATWFKCGWLAF